MNLTDPIADMLTRIRNGCMNGNPEVSMPASKMKVSIAEVLKDKGYIGDFQVEEGATGKSITIELKYQGTKKRTPVIEGLERVSKPSCRVYVGAKEVPRPLGGLGVAVLSTPKGVLADKQAREENVGGEVLCYVW